MPQPPATLLEPRKSPVQARSTASVDAILDATIQVLLAVGKERLTTTRVAARAGVSVGTLYQYFPNKSALLQSVLKRHLGKVVEAVEVACEEQKGRPLREMATALMTSFLDVKMKDPTTSAALYAVSSDIDGLRIRKQTGIRYDKAIVAMLKTTSDPLATDPQLISALLQGAMFGVSRTILESAAPKEQSAILGRELVLLACAYVEASSARPASPQQASGQPSPPTATAPRQISRGWRNGARSLRPLPPAVSGTKKQTTQ